MFQRIFFKEKKVALRKTEKNFPLGALWHIYHSIWEMGKNIMYRNSRNPTIEHGRGAGGMAWD